MWAELLLQLSFLQPVPVAEKPVDLGKSTIWVAESAPMETPEEAMKELLARPEGPSRKGANLGFKKVDYWFLTRIKNQQTSDQLVFRFLFHNLGKIQFWTNTGEGWVTYPLQGRTTDPRLRDFYGRTANYVVGTKPGQEILVLYKIKTLTPLNANITVSSVQAYLDTQTRENRLLMAAYGITFMMAFYHFFLFWQRRQRIDIIYALATLMIGLVNPFLQGHIFQYVTGLINPAIHEAVNTTLVPPTWIFMFEFAILFLSLKRFFPVGQNILRVFQGLCLVQPVLYIAVGFRLSNIYSQIYGLIAPISILVVALIALRRGQTAARFFVAAYSLYLLSIVVFLLKNMGIIALGEIFGFAMVIGSALQVTLLALALGDRMKILKKQKAETERVRRLEEENHQRDVLAWNASLEGKIKEQTRDIRSMLDHAKIGLLSVTGDLDIHKDYTRFLEHILEEDTISGRPFIEVLLDRLHLGPDDREKILTAIEYSIGEDEIFFEANASVFPREVAITVGDKTKYLDFDWSPIVNKQGAIERILVSLRDQTENLRLRAEAEEGRRSLKYLSELLDIGPLRYGKFDVAADQTWASCREILAEAKPRGVLEKEGVRKIYVGFHTIKGVARMYKLSDLTQAIHLAEECVADKNSLSSDEIQSLEAALDKIVEAQAVYKKTVEPLVRLRDQLTHLKGDIQQNPNDLRVVIQDMAEVANTLAKELGKGGCQMVIEIEAGVTLTPSYAKAFADSLIHLVRNSVDHGLETTEERLQKGKSPTGTIRIYRDEAGRICLEDDGRGLNLGAIQRKAEKLGRKETEPLALANLIFDSGFSTKASATDVSGRGVGMDAVREFMLSVGSNIQIVPHKVEEGYLKFHFAIDLPEILSRKAS